MVDGGGVSYPCLRFRPGLAGAVIELTEARPDTQAVLLGDHGVLAFGPDTETAVSLLVALEEAAAAELRAAVLGD
ncbi:MAG: hypothetical protein JWO75_5192 [Actinomycetia bacterium]|nr:hypothetical protein [Actinomycetes bacterium]